MPISRHALRQLEYILPGALITYYYHTPSTFLHIFHGDLGSHGVWARNLASISLTSGFLTVMLFLYILLLPLIKGQQPNYRSWQTSPDLATTIPILTASIVIGWSLSTFTLGQWSGLGYARGIVATTGFYALSFGLLGLLPVPKVRRR